jgi:hypothetical protein
MEIHNGMTIRDLEKTVISVESKPYIVPSKKLQPVLLTSDLERMLEDVRSESPIELSMYYGGKKLKAAEWFINREGRIHITVEEAE